MFHDTKQESKRGNKNDNRCTRVVTTVTSPFQAPSSIKKD